MATFTGVGSGTTGASRYTLKLDVWESYVGGSSENYSTVNWQLNLVSGGYSFADWGIPTYVNVDGEVYNASPKLSIGVNSEITIASGSKNIWHDNNGTKTISCSASINNTGAYYLPGIASCGGTVTLTNIPRYATVYQSLNTRTINTIKMNWSTDVPRDHTQYSVNGGAWTDAGDTVASDNKSGTYIISNLEPNTKYNIKTRVKRTDSQLWSETGSTAVTTYDYAKITEVPNITIGENATIKYTNPSGASIQVGLLKDSTEIIADYRSASGTSYTFKFTEEEIDNIYKSELNSAKISLRYYIKTTQNAKTYYHYKNGTFSVDLILDKPIFNNFVFEDINPKTLALTGNSQDMVSGYSKEQITIKASDKAIGKNFAKIIKYKFTIGNQTKEIDYSDTTNVSVIIEKPVSATITVTAIDSRGLQTSVVKTANFISYTKPNVELVKVTRENGVGEKTYFELTASYFGNNFANTNPLTVYYRYKKKSEEEYSDWYDITAFEGIIIEDTSIKNTKSNNYIPNISAGQKYNDLGNQTYNSYTTEKYEDFIGGTFVPNEFMPFTAGIEYDIEFRVVDGLDENSRGNVLSSGIPCTAKRKNKNGTYSMGINKFPDEDTALDVLGNVKISDNLKYSNTYVHSALGKNATLGYVKIAEIEVVSTYADQPMEFRVCRRGAKIISTITLRLKSIYGTNPDLYSFEITGEDIPTYIHRFSDSIWHLYIQKSEAYDVVSINGFTKGYYMNRINVKFIEDFTDTLPTDCIKADYFEMSTFKTLYNNTSGTTGTVILSETSANFKYIEVFGRYGTAYYTSVKIPEPNGKGFNLTTAMMNQTVSLGHIASTNYTVSGTSITPQYYGEWHTGDSSFTKTNNITILKVVGYR